MAEGSRLDDLRRRVDKDPASIAFAQLAEEYRRAGQLDDAVAVCRAGLKIHPAYLSARVTLGRALLELEQLDDAQQELDQVLRSAPENLAALRGVAEVHHRRGDLAQALAHYRSALALARNDPDLEQTVEDLTHQIEHPAPGGAVSLEQTGPEPVPPAPQADPETATPSLAVSSEMVAPAALDVPESAFSIEATALVADEPAAFVTPSASPAPAAAAAVLVATEEATEENPSDARRAHAMQEIAALERWLEAIHVARANQYA